MTNPTSISSETPASDRPGAWLRWSGRLLVGLGALALLTVGLSIHPDWWAIFILAPAAGLLWAALAAYRRSRGAFNAVVRASLASGLIVLTVALIFLLRLDWGSAWTLMVIVPGLALFLNGFTRPRARFGSPAGSAANALFWLGGSVAALGAVFLLDQIGLISLPTLFGDTRWWSAFILLAGLGALLNAFAMYATRGSGPVAAALLVAGLVLCLEAWAEFVGFPWQWRAPLALTLGGLTFLADALMPRRRA